MDKEARIAYDFYYGSGNTMEDLNDPERKSKASHQILAPKI